jgi:sRNA-binding protein
MLQIHNVVEGMVGECLLQDHKHSEKKSKAHCGTKLRRQLRKYVSLRGLHCGRPETPNLDSTGQICVVASQHLSLKDPVSQAQLHLSHTITGLPFDKI